MKVVQTTLSDAEHKLLQEYARMNSKTIKEALRVAIRKALEGEVNPSDPVFASPPSSKRTGKEDRGSVEHDRYLYGEKP